MNPFTWLMNWITGKAPAPEANPPVHFPDVIWPPNDAAIVLACTAWMEDRSGGETGMQAVMNVVCNRAANPRWWGTDIVSVCYAPAQFSCWNQGSTQIPLARAATVSGDPQYVIAIRLATLAVQGLLPDVTGNADSYYAAQDKSPPLWSHSAPFCGSIGGNLFYRLYLSAPKAVEPS